MHLQNGNLKNESWQRSFTSQAFQIPDKKNSPNFFLQAKLKYFQHFSSKIASRLEQKKRKRKYKKEKENPWELGRKKTWYQFFLCFKNKLSNMSKIALLSVCSFCKFQRKKRFCQLDRCALKFDIVLYKMITNTSAFISKN